MADQFLFAVLIIAILFVIILIIIFAWKKGRRAPEMEEMPEQDYLPEYSRKVFRCPQCHEETDPYANNCYSCGAEFQEGEFECPKCGTAVDPDMIECPKCGEILEQEASICPKCGKAVKLDSTQCERCGEVFWSPLINPPKEEEAPQKLLRGKEED